MCVPLTERMQVLLTPQQRRRLERIARDESRSVGSVIREAIARFAPEDLASDDLQTIFDLDLPVGDWADMKAEIIRAASR